MGKGGEREKGKIRRINNSMCFYEATRGPNVKLSKRLNKIDRACIASLQEGLQRESRGKKFMICSPHDAKTNNRLTIFYIHSYG